MTAQNAGGVDADRFDQVVHAMQRAGQGACSVEFYETLARAALSAVSPDAATVDDAMVERALQGQLSFYDDPANLEDCANCEGSGEWLGEVCDGCGGAGRNFIGTDKDMMRAALQAARVPDGGTCETCNGHGLIGGHSGQTPESYEEVTEACPDCVPDGAGGKAVAWAYRSEDPYDAGQWMLAGPSWEGEGRPNRREVIELFTHPPAPEPSLSREGASVSNAVKIVAEEMRKAAEVMRRDGEQPDIRLLTLSLESWADRLATPNPTTLAAIADSYSGKVETAESVDGLVDGVTATPAGQDANQCDGCRSGALLDDSGLHRDRSGYAFMVCQRERYIPTERTPQRGGEMPPPNTLPTWQKCEGIISSYEFHQRAVAGLEGPQLVTIDEDPREPTALERFIYEYDDSDSYKSAWFMHRLELVVNELSASAARSGGDGPDFPDGCSRDGFAGGCERMGCHPVSDYMKLSQDATNEIWSVVLHREHKTPGERKRAIEGVIRAALEAALGRNSTLGGWDEGVDPLYGEPCAKPLPNPYAALQPNTTGEG